MINFDAGLVGPLTVTQEDVQKTVGVGRYWPRQAHGLETGAWTYDGLWMPPNAPPKSRVYPWGDKCRSTLVLGTDKSNWSTTQADILKPPSESELLYARRHTQKISGAVPGASETKGPLKLDQSPYNAMTGLRKSNIASTQRLAVPGKRAMAASTVSDDVADQLDSTLLALRPDPRVALTTPLSEVRDHFRHPDAMRAYGRTAGGLDESRFLGERKYCGKSAGPPGW